MPTDSPDKPLHLKLVSITDRPARRVRPLPKAPAHMTPAGRRAWAFLVPLVPAKVVLEPQHVIPLERMAEAYGEILQARELIAKPLRATFFDKKTGQPEQREIAPAGSRYYETGARSGPSHRERPEYAVIRHATRVLRAYLAEFGLPPAAVAGGPAGRLGRA